MTRPRRAAQSEDRQLTPRSEKLLDDPDVMFWVLPAFDHASQGSSHSGAQFQLQKYDQVYNLLNSIFDDDMIDSFVYSGYQDGDSQQFSACRVACLTINNHVAAALTFRPTGADQCGPALMVRFS